MTHLQRDHFQMADKSEEGLTVYKPREIIIKETIPWISRLLLPACLFCLQLLYLQSGLKKESGRTTHEYLQFNNKGTCLQENKFSDHSLHSDNCGNSIRGNLYH